MDDEVRPGGFDVQELAVPAHARDGLVVQRRRRRVESLEHVKRADVDAGDAMSDRMAHEKVGEGGNFRQLGHAFDNA